MWSLSYVVGLIIGMLEYICTRQFQAIYTWYCYVHVDDTTSDKTDAPRPVS